jgi:L-2,4-diaminobutyric acid acetyltransferase
MTGNGDLTLGPPGDGDGARMHALAHRAGGLDVNSTYAYVLWTRDFAGTTSVAHDEAGMVAYCLGYLRPAEPDTYFVWQIAVDPRARGRGLATALLDEVVDRCGAHALEATVTPGNEASRRLFASFASTRGATLTTVPLFPAEELGGDHDPEDLIRLGPLRA